jgi:hypothetical protein
MPGFINFEAGFRSTLAASKDYQFEFYVECMDLTRFPDVCKVFVVTGASPYDQTLEGTAREELRSLENRVELCCISGLSLEDLIHRVSSLPEHSLVFYISVFGDGSGKAFNFPDALALISKQANAPICRIVPALGRTQAN